MTKSLVILALGGGVVGDISGFVASTYKCGVRFIQVPTSFLAQIDSSIGGKNAINFNGIKNVIGTVYQPELIYINYSILSSLSPKELINGLVEMTVHGIIREKSLFEFLENNDIQSLDDFNGQLEEIIIKNCNVKLEIVKEDELDYNVRKILNFGHTIGHAIEGYYMFKYSHGECVAVGIVGSFLVGKRLGITPQNLVARIITYIKKMKINIHLSDMDVNEVLHLVEWDKKNNGKYISYIIPVDIGIVKMVNLSDNSCIEQAINDLIVIFN